VKSSLPWNSESLFLLKTIFTSSPSQHSDDKLKIIFFENVEKSKYDAINYAFSHIGKKISNNHDLNIQRNCFL
jgi:hypothetical protein